VKGIFLIITMLAMLFGAGCGLVGPANEEINRQPGKTSFRSADHSSADSEVATPTGQKVPGE
jgi:hypothetical protein